MRQMKISELTPGIIIAQHILNQENDILLAAGAVLTAKTIELLESWKVSEVRVKEDKDTDEDIEMALQFDEISRQHSRPLPQTADPDFTDTLTEADFPAISDETEPPLQLEITPDMPLPSIINEKSVMQYETLHQRFHAILKNRVAYTNPAKLADLANIICRYVLSTPGAIGYALRDPEKGEPSELLTRHSMTVAVVAAKLGRLLRYSGDELRLITLGALIHDIGKMLLPPHFSETSASRNFQNDQLYRSHVQVGYDLLKQNSFPREALFILMQHHETLDGSGYPLCLAPGKMHPYAQIVALANRFDVLFHAQEGLPNLFDIRPRLLKDSAGKISTEILDAFDRYLEDFVFTANVELNDGRKAEIIYTHHAYESPVVRVASGELLDLNKQKSLKVARLSL